MSNEQTTQPSAVPVETTTPSTAQPETKQETTTGS